MSDCDDNISNSSDSDSVDDWQDYYSDPEDIALDDNALPPVIIKEKYKLDQCSICFEDLDTEIGTLDTCVHMFCLKCISLWAKISKTCPQDGRKFSSILKFVMREGNVMYLHENGAKISCGRQDMPQSNQNPQNPNNNAIPQYTIRFENQYGVLSEPIWRWRLHKYEPPAGRWIQQECFRTSNIFRKPRFRWGRDEFFSDFVMLSGRRLVRPYKNRGIREPNSQKYNSNNSSDIAITSRWDLCPRERCPSRFQTPPSSELDSDEKFCINHTKTISETLNEERFGKKIFRKFRFMYYASLEFQQQLPVTSQISLNPQVHGNLNKHPYSEVD